MLEVVVADGGAEPERRDADAHPGELVGDTDNVLEPGPELASADVAGSEAETVDYGCCEDGDPGNAEAVKVAQEAWGVALHC